MIISVTIAPSINISFVMCTIRWAFPGQFLWKKERICREKVAGKKDLTFASSSGIIIFALCV